MNGSRTRSAAFSAIRCVRKRSRESAWWTCKGITTRCVLMLRGYLTKLGCCTGGTIICSSSQGRDRTAGNWRRCSEGYCGGWRKWRRHFTWWCTRRLTRETRRANLSGYWKTLPDDYHWHIEILPIVERRSKSYSIKEVYFNAELPEQAAANLRALDPNS